MTTLVLPEKEQGLGLDEAVDKLTILLSQPESHTTHAI